MNDDRPLPHRSIMLQLVGAVVLAMLLAGVTASLCIIGMQPMLRHRLQRISEASDAEGLALGKALAEARSHAVPPDAMQAQVDRLAAQLASSGVRSVTAFDARQRVLARNRGAAAVADVPGAIERARVLGLQMQASGGYVVLPQQALADGGYLLQIDSRPWAAIHKYNLLIGLSYFAAFTVGLLVMIGFGWRLARRIRTMAARLQRYDPGIPLRLATQGSDELTELARSFNRLKAAQEHQEVRERQAMERHRSLIAGIAHDLRSPVASLVGYLELAQDMSELTNRQAGHLATAQRKAQQLAARIQGLFDYARISSMEALDAAKMAPLDLALLIRQEVDENRSLFERVLIDVSLEGAHTQSLVLADVHLMHRAVDNLLANVLQHAQGTRLEIRLVQTEADLQVTMANPVRSKPPPEDPSSTVKQGDGAGIGIRVVRHIVQLHGGRFDVHRSANQFVAAFSLPLRRDG